MGIEDFFEYSYVGGPIYPESHPTIEWQMIANKDGHHFGGNGEFSFRRRSFMLKQLEECKLKLIGDEDSWYSECLKSTISNTSHDKQV